MLIPRNSTNRPCGAAENPSLAGAARHQNWAAVRVLLEQKAPVDGRLGDGATLPEGTDTQLKLTSTETAPPPGNGT